VSGTAPVFHCHDLEIDSGARTVRRAGQLIPLTPLEYTLLLFLAENCGRVVTRAMMVEHLYDEYDENTNSVIDAYPRYLRNKIDKGFDLPLILTKWGEGYHLRDRGGPGGPPVVFDPRWRTDTAVALARLMDESRDFSAMPILADALQDAGCDNNDILEHCRGPGPHVRGCWVVDLVLGKE
jgi:hypothetical protein